MANTINNQDVFKFVTMRAPVVLTEKDEKEHFTKDERVLEETPVGRIVQQAGTKDPRRIAALLGELAKSRNYEPRMEDKHGLVKKIFAYGEGAGDDVTGSDLKKAIEKILNKPIKDFLESGEGRELLEEAWDRYDCYYLMNRVTPYNLEYLTKTLRVFHMLSVLKDDPNITKSEDLKKILYATPLVDKGLVDLTRPDKTTKADAPAGTSPQQKEKEEKYRGLWKSFVEANHTLTDVNSLVQNKKMLKTEKITATLQGKKDATIKSESNMLHNDVIKGTTGFEILSDKSKNLLNKLEVSNDAFQVLGAQTQLTNKLHTLYNQMLAFNDPDLLLYMPEEAQIIPGVQSVASALQATPYSVPVYLTGPGLSGSSGISARSLIKPLGVGDLRIVKQKLRKYVSGEVAHIENVLKGESKDREHRVLDRTEDILTVSEETDEETVKDTQTTERFELKKESEKTIQEQMSIQAGVTVSGSYGMVNFGAHADFAYSTSSTESNKSASNFAREVVDKSVSKIQKKTKTERTTKTLHEVEEINKHGLNNVAGNENIAGIYRWVDKYYDAQVYNYGKRMMFEFIIPEPSTFFEFAQNNKPKKNIMKPVPMPSTLTHKDVTDWNFQTYIKNYNVQGVTPPPPATKTISLSIDQSGIDNGRTFSKSSKELVVPEGYISTGLGFSMSAIYENNPQLKLSIGNDAGWATLTDNDSRRRNDFVSPAGFPFEYDSVIPVGIDGYDINAFFINITVTCSRTDAKYELWQIQTFEKILAAYKAAMAEYEQKVNAAETQQGIVIQGQNPRINREIEKLELKKGCVKMLMDTGIYGGFNAMESTVPPDFDIFDAITEGKIIQFFEQAFEWENLTYLFYPYFWGRIDQWVHKSTTFDTDPLFTQFLQAGSARVVIPVHPAYNDAVLHYLETGYLWPGGESPRINDPLFISIHEELKNQTDDIGNATPEGDKWEVVLPTTLVYLQQDSDLPEYN